MRLVLLSTMGLVGPSLLDGGPQSDARPGEVFGLWLERLVRPLIPARYRAVRTEAVARALLRAALQAQPGQQVLANETT